MHTLPCSVSSSLTHHVLHFSHKHLLTAADESLHLYDTAAGTLVKTLFAKTYGVSRVACTHAPLAVLTASGANRSDHDVRYHSLYDNTYLRFFKVCIRHPPCPPICVPLTTPPRTSLAA